MQHNACKPITTFGLHHGLLNRPGLSPALPGRTAVTHALKDRSGFVDVMTYRPIGLYRTVVSHVLTYSRKCLPVSGSSEHGDVDGRK